jgi:hypothetical protein
VRDDACAWIERNRVGASALLSDESGDAQCKSGDKEYCPKIPSKRALRERRRHKRFDDKQRDDWQNE